MTHVEYVYLDDNWNVNIFQVLFCSPRDLTVADKTFVTRIQVCSAGFFKECLTSGTSKNSPIVLERYSKSSLNKSICFVEISRGKPDFSGFWVSMNLGPQYFPPKGHDPSVRQQPVVNLPTSKGRCWLRDQCSLTSPVHIPKWQEFSVLTYITYMMDYDGITKCMVLSEE